MNGNADWVVARRNLPLELVLEQRGAPANRCPVCRSTASIEVIGGKIDEGFCRSVSESTDLIHLAESLVGPLKRAGAAYQGRCPKCPENRTNLRFYKKGVWLCRCFHCDEVKGDAIALLKAAQGMDFPDAIRFLAQILGREVEYESPRKVMRCFNGSCEASSEPLDEPGVLGVLDGLKRREAVIRYLQEGGVKKGERLSPSLMPGSQKRGGDWDKAVDEREAEAPVAPDVGPRPEESNPKDQPDLTLELLDEAEAAVREWAAPTIAVYELQRRFKLGFNNAVLLMNAMEARGVVGPGGATDARQIRRPDEPQEPDDFEDDADDSAGPEAESEPKTETAPPMEDLDEADIITPGGRLKTTRVEVTNDLVLEVTRWFYDRLEWLEYDCEKLFVDRGLEPHTNRVMGFRSNHPGNLKHLLAMPDRYPLEVCVQAGFWSWRNREEWLGGGEVHELRGARPSEFFYGKGFAGEKTDPKTKRKVPVFEWNRAVIIPYFNNIPAATDPKHSDRATDAAAIMSGPAANYEVVVVTEGEFKAAALWQAYAQKAQNIPEQLTERLISLRTHKKSIPGSQAIPYLTPPGNRINGVAAVPGISYWRRNGGSWLCQHMLRQFIHRTGCKFATLAYDNEDKSHQFLPNGARNPKYKSQPWKRHDTMVFARLMGMDIAKELGLVVGTTLIPAEFRNAEGKADWDGILADLLRDGPAGTPAEPVDPGPSHVPEHEEEFP